MFQLRLLPRAAFDPILVNDPIYLRTAANDDFDSWVALREESRSHLVAWEDDWSPEQLSEISFRRRMRNGAREAKRGAGLALFVFRREDQALLGGLTLANIRYGAARSAVLGYWIGAPYVRSGYAFAAVRAALSHAFDAIALNRIEAACDPENTASRSLLLKCGFQFEGRARDYLKINGAWRDHDIYAITAGDYRDSDPGPVVAY
ncbi:MAG: GNAT family protein [Pseudomonadota bacterium]